MKIATIIGICALACASALGCSGASSSGQGGDNGGDSGSNSGGSGSSNSGNGGSGATGSGSTGSGSTGSGASSGLDLGVDAGGGGIVTTKADSGLMDDEIDYSQTETLTMDTFTVQPGAEVYYCQTFLNPWGKTVDIKEYNLSMSQGSHHMFAFYAPNATASANAPCPNGGLTFGAFTFTSQSPTLDQVYPNTVGATLPSTTGFQMMVHYLNTSSNTITAHISLTMNVAKPNVVTNHAGVLFLNNIAMDVYTGGPAQTSTYTLTQDVNILSTDSHMHEGGPGGSATFLSTYSPGTTTLFSTNEWAEPVGKTFPTPLKLTKGTTITWSCDYTVVNVSALKPMTFGESALTNVMCISVSIFYPVSDPTNPVLGDTSGFNL